MRFAALASVFTLASTALVLACTGGPGALPNEGGETGDQYGSIQGDTSNNGVSGGDSTGTGSSSSSTSGSPVVTYEPQKDLLAKDYDQSCSQDTDCQPVSEGAICTPCSCNTAAVNSKDYVKFLTEQSSRKSKCDPALLSGTCSPCENKTAKCDSGSKKCVVQ